MVTEMTTETLEQPTRPLSWGEIAVRFANDLAAEGFPRGGLAELRRMDPDAPDAASFWRLMANHDLQVGPELESKWAVILHGVALMTRTAANTALERSAHARNMPVGQALYLGGVEDRQSAFYSPSRFSRLLTARGPMLRTLLTRMFRMMGSSRVRFNWYQMALLILYDGYDEERADSIRREIARDYYWAESRAFRPQT